MRLHDDGKEASSPRDLLWSSLVCTAKEPVPSHPCGVRGPICVLALPTGIRGCISGSGPLPLVLSSSCILSNDNKPGLSMERLYSAGLSREGEGLLQ